MSKTVHLPKIEKLVTIGAYGFEEQGFFDALLSAGVDTFCDVRFRRGVRGRACAFVNSQRLQAGLSERGITYLHFRDLAPSTELRNRQAAADREGHLTKRQRTELSPEFIQGYGEEVLRSFSSQGFLGRLPPTARVVVLFCVEGQPSACHRALLAKQLQKDLGVDVVHLEPK